MRDFDKAIAAAVAVVLAAMCCAGCATTRGSGQSAEEEIALEPVDIDTMLAVADSSRFDDIPVPATMVYDRERSFAFENDQMRVAYLVYEGKAELAEVVQFLLTNLAGDGWQLGNVFEHDETTLAFSEKNRKEQLTVSVGQSGRNVIMRFTLTPAGPSRIAGP